MSNYEGYHGGETASVPFTWESQPGTPKVNFRDTPLPPLTPPPSFTYSINKPHNNKSSSSSSSKPNLFQSIFPKRTARKARVLQRPPANASPAFSFSSSTSSCSSSSYNSRSASPVRLRSRSVPSSPVRRQRKKEEEEDGYNVDVSGLCFGNAGSRGCYSSMIKKLLLRHFV